MNQTAGMRVLWLAEDESAAGAPAAIGNGGLAVVETATGLDHYVNAGPTDAVVIALGAGRPLQAVLDWGLLSAASHEAALVVVAPSIDEASALRLLQAGVQDVVGHDALATLPQRLRWSVERKRVESQVLKASTADLMTGLPNRTQFVEHVSQLLALRERENTALNLLVLRIGGVAGVEAGHGIESANAVRRKVAVRIRAGLRSSDVVASLGADVFAILLPSTATLPDVQRVVIKLMRALRDPFPVAGSTVGVTAHAGVAQFPADGRQPDELLRLATTRAMASVHDSGGGAANE